MSGLPGCSGCFSIYLSLSLTCGFGAIWLIERTLNGIPHARSEDNRKEDRDGGLDEDLSREGERGYIGSHVGRLVCGDRFRRKSRSYLR